jgi:hypothetical protein
MTFRVSGHGYCIRRLSMRPVRGTAGAAVGSKNCLEHVAAIAAFFRQVHRRRRSATAAGLGGSAPDRQGRLRPVGQSLSPNLPTLPGTVQRNLEEPPIRGASPCSLAWPGKSSSSAPRPNCRGSATGCARSNPRPKRRSPDYLGATRARSGSSFNTVDPAGRP